MSSSFDDLELGSRVTTHSRTITRADISNFAGVSGDFNPLHLSDDVGAASPFDECVAHGALMFSVMSGLLWQTRRERADIVAFYGVDNLRFTNPVFVGDTVHVEAELTEKVSRDHPRANGVVRYETDVVNQRDDVVIACEMLSLVR